jgi:hypothetical protein
VFEPAFDLDTSAIKSEPEDQQWINAYNFKKIDNAVYMLVRDNNTYMQALKKFNLTTGMSTD